MIKAYILINTKPGKEEDVIKKIESLNTKLLDKAILYGEFDILIKVETKNIEDLRNIILENIRKIDGVDRTITLIVASM